MGACMLYYVFMHVHVCMYECTLADPELQKLGGQIFSEIFERPFLGVSPKFQHFPKMSFVSQNFCGPFLLFDKLTMLSLICLPPKGGPNSIANFDAGHGGACPPWIRHCVCMYMYVCINVCIFLYMYIFMHACMHVCIHAHAYSM